MSFYIYKYLQFLMELVLKTAIIFLSVAVTQQSSDWMIIGRWKGVLFENKQQSNDTPPSFATIL